MSFRDVHFGACPVVAQPSYREEVILALPHLLLLDGLEVSEADVRSARDAKRAKVLAYNLRVEEIARNFEREMRAIELVPALLCCWFAFLRFLCLRFFRFCVCVCSFFPL